MYIGETKMLDKIVLTGIHGVTLAKSITRLLIDRAREDAFLTDPPELFFNDLIISLSVKPTDHEYERERCHFANCWLGEFFDCYYEVEVFPLNQQESVIYDIICGIYDAVYETLLDLDLYIDGLLHYHFSEIRNGLIVLKLERYL